MIPDFPTWVLGLMLLGLVAAACVITLAVVTVVRLAAGVRAHARLESGDGS